MGRCPQPFTISHNWPHGVGIDPTKLVMRREALAQDRADVTVMMPARLQFRTVTRRLPSKRRERENREGFEEVVRSSAQQA